MKGINMKKIGAIVAGATILASSVAFAGGLMYQNTELVNADGQPLAKVVIGSNSMASDGVAGALISNKLANEAYKSSTLTAEVVGTGVCNGAAGGTGTCDIVEGSKKVTLEVTVPGAGMFGVHDFTTAIGDYVDRKLENRYSVGGNSDEAYTVYDAFDDEDGNPLQNMIGDELTNSDFTRGDVEESAFYRIGAHNFGPFADATVVLAKTGKEYKEKQDVWIHGNNYWDEGDSRNYGEVTYMVYSALFDATGDYGIPLCPGDEDNAYNADGDFVCSDMDRLPAQKVYVKFMGEDWVISSVESFQGNPTPTVDTQVFQVNGAKLKLAKEAVSGIINVGEIMESPSGYKIRLDDISRETGQDNKHPAIITVLDANDNEVCQDQVFEGQTKDDLCSVHTGVKLHVYQTAPGLNFIAKWAEMAIYKDEIELESGKRFLDDSDTEWDVYLGWSTKGAGWQDEPEYLREILLYTDNPDGFDEMRAGDAFPVVDVPDYGVYSLVYNGIEDKEADYDSLKYKATYKSTGTTFKVRYDPLDSDAKCEIVTDYALEMTTSSGEFKTDLLPYGFATATKRGNHVWYIDVDTAGYDTSDCDALGPALVDDSRDLVVLKDHNGEYFLYEIAEVGFDPGFGCDEQALSFQYKYAGSDGYAIYYDDTPSGCTGSQLNEFGFAENAGSWDDPNSDVGNRIAAGPVMSWDGEELGASDWEAPVGLGDEDYIQYVVGDPAADGYPFDAANCDYLETGFNVLGYEGAVPPGACMWTAADSQYEEGFVTLRGSKFRSGSKKEYRFDVSKNLLKTSWSFSTVEAADADPDTVELVLFEGEEKAVGTTGVKIKAKLIEQQLTPCTVGAGVGDAPACDMSTVSAVIMPNNAPSVNTIVPYSLTSNLVYLDTDSVALDTGVIITVGGDAVNTVTRDAIMGSDVDFEATPVVVKQVGNKIVVAGYTASDTMAAAQQFLAQLTK